LIFSPFLLRLKLFDVTARDVIRIIQQKISDAEQAGVREVPLLNLRRLIDQIEQDILGDHAKTPHRTQSGSSRSKLNTGIMNETQKILTVAALVVFIAFGAFHYLKVKDFYHLTPTLGVPILGTSGPAHAIMSDVMTPWFHARRDLHRVVFLAAK
jgi:hypothetical protein